MKKIHTLIFLALVSLLILSCSKGEQGDIGPAGTNGAKGATGDKGDVGITNSKGMIVTAWFEAKPTDWTLYNGTTSDYYLSLTYNSLTKDVASKGGIYSYMQPVGSSTVYALPYIENNVYKVLSFIYNGNAVPEIEYSIRFSAANTKVTSNYKLRSVFIPAAARMSADVDWNNYEEVKKYLNLND